VGTVDAGVEAGAEAGAELPDGEADGDVAPGLAAAEEAVVGLTAVDGAASRATVAATGSDEGARLHFAAPAVPCCSERVAAAT
jgi:hypothetical protein